MSTERRSSVTPHAATHPTADPVVRLAVRRAYDGVTLNEQEVLTLLHARGDDLAQMCAAAARMRDAGLVQAGRPGVVNYSRRP